MDDDETNGRRHMSPDYSRVSLRVSLDLDDSI